MSDFIKLPPEARPNWMEDMDRLTAEVERLQAVVDAARKKCREIIREENNDAFGLHGIAALAAREILRALDGEP